MKIFETAMKLIVCLLFCLNHFPCEAQSPQMVSFHGIKIFVKDLKEAKRFYTNVLGFATLSESNDQIVLKTNEYPIYLKRTSSLKSRNSIQEAHVGLSLETSKLLPTIDLFRKLKVKMHDTELVKNGVGIAIPFEDPSGNVLHLVEVQIREVPAFSGVRLYNSGITITNMESAIKLYEEVLGFEEWSRNYLPNALPLKHKDGTFAFMIHIRNNLTRNSSSYGSYPSMVLMFQVKSIDNFETYLTKKEIRISYSSGVLSLQDSEGNYMEIINESN